MMNRTSKVIFYFVHILSVCLLCSVVFADLAREEQIVKINGISFYMTPANQILSAAKKRNIDVSENKSSDSTVEFTVANSKLLTELLSLYKDSMSKNNSYNEGNIVLQESTDNSILEAIQVHKARSLVIGVKFFRRQK